MTTAIITMAGFGRRFIEAGYAIPKYRIVVHDRTLFAWSMLSLRSFIESGAKFVFVMRAEDNARDFVQDAAARLGISDVSIIDLPAPTDGQATTAIAAKSAIAEPHRPVLIYNIDTFVHPDMLPAEAVKGDGWIPCFAAKGDAWSFAAATATGRITEVREKVRISPHATVGLYWFGSFDLYEGAYLRHYSKASNIEMGERYVAPLYNTLIAEGRDIYLHDVPAAAVIPLGVPADVEAFARRSPPEIGMRP